MLVNIIKMAELKLSTTQVRFLDLVASGVQETQALARELSLTRPAVDHQVELLKELGMVKTAQEATGWKRITISLTQEGREALKDLQAA